MEREQRRRLREIRRRRGQNVNEAPEVRAAWQRCRELSLAYLDAVIAAHASGCPGAVAGLRQVRPSRPRRAGRAPGPRSSRLGPAHGGHALVPGADARASRGSRRSRPRSSPPGASTPSMPASRSEATNCAGFDVERARLFKAGATRGRLRRRGRAGPADRRRHGPLGPRGRGRDPARGAARPRAATGRFKHRCRKIALADPADPRLGIPGLLADSRTTATCRPPRSPTCWPTTRRSPRSSLRRCVVATSPDDLYQLSRSDNNPIGRQADATRPWMLCWTSTAWCWRLAPPVTTGRSSWCAGCRHPSNGLTGWTIR